MNNATAKIVQEFNEESSEHRLRNTETGDVTYWAHYTFFTYLDGVVGYTTYWATKEGTCTPEEFMELAAVRKVST
jgi:hypothetical protein